MKVRGKRSSRKMVRRKRGRRVSAKVVPVRSNRPRTKRRRRSNGRFDSKKAHKSERHGHTMQLRPIEDRGWCGCVLCCRFCTWSCSAYHLTLFVRYTSVRPNRFEQTDLATGVRRDEP